MTFASSTTYALLAKRARESGPVQGLFQPIPGKGEAKHHIYTWGQFHDAVREIAVGLRGLGVKKGDVVLLHAETRAEFFLADLGVQAVGAIAGALYTSYPATQQVGTIRNSGAAVLLAENPKVLRQLRDALEPETAMQYVLLTGEAEGALPLEALRAQGRATLAADPGLFDRMQQEYSVEDYAILYLTSGATGEPKMGLVTHQAITSNLSMARKILTLTAQDRTLVFLPSANITQRLALQMLPIDFGMPVYFSEGLSKMPGELRTVKPTFFVAPPRVWERVYTTVCTEVKKQPGYKQRLFWAALGAGLKAADYRQRGESVPGWLEATLKLADRVVFGKVKQRLGGELRIPVSGSAPLGRDIAKFYAAIGLPLREGYGLTEGGVVCLNPIDAPRVGTIGKLLPGVEARLSDEGELLLKSPTLFSGYLNDEAATKMVLRDGWLHTGDVAEIDADGFVHITGRKKELIVSSNGKKIYPVKVEALFKTEPLVNQMVLIGDRLPFATALFTVNTVAAESLPGADELKGKSPEEIAKSALVEKGLQEAVARVNRQLADFERIRKFRVLEREFSVERGELTPTMKVRRQKVLEDNKELIQGMYAGKEEFVG